MLKVINDIGKTNVSDGIVDGKHGKTCVGKISVQALGLLRITAKVRQV